MLPLSDARETQSGGKPPHSTIGYSRSSSLQQRPDALGGLDTGLQLRDQGHAHVAGARIASGGRTGQVPTGQHRNVDLPLEVPSEGLIVAEELIRPFKPASKKAAGGGGSGGGASGGSSAGGSSRPPATPKPQ